MHTSAVERPTSHHDLDVSSARRHDVGCNFIRARNPGYSEKGDGHGALGLCSDQTRNRGDFMGGDGRGRARARARSRSSTGQEVVQWSKLFC
jgi:hypothetical protein